MRRPAAREHLLGRGAPGRAGRPGRRAATRRSGTRISPSTAAAACGGSGRMPTSSRTGRARPLGCVILLRDVSDRVLMEERVRLDGAVRQPGHPGLRAAPRDQEPADGAEHPRPAPGGAARATRRPTKPVDELIGVLKSEVRRLNGVARQLPRLRQPPAPDPPAGRRPGGPRGHRPPDRPQAAQQHVEVTLRRPRRRCRGCRSTPRRSSRPS